MTLCLEDLQARVQTLNDAGIIKYPSRKGKAAIPPWHLLKELAAYRLNKFGAMSRKDVLEFVEGEVEKDNAPDPSKVLPIYSASGFTEAVESAEERIGLMLPKPAVLSDQPISEATLPYEEEDSES